MKNPIKQETDNSQQAEDWNASFLASRPIELDGKKYLIVDRSFWFEALAFRKMTVSLVPYVEGTAEPTVKVLNLSNPPAGATHYHPRDEKNPFRKAANGVSFAWIGSTSKWVQIKNKWAQNSWERLPLQGPMIADLIEQGYLTSPTLHCQWVGRGQRQTFSADNPQHQQIPKAAQWDGEGLPPVGVDCEALRLGQWIKCRIFAHRYGRALFDFEGGWGDCDDLTRFRPIKTAEQLAAEQREAEVGRIRNVINDALSVAGDPAVALHNLGVRVWGDE